MTDVLIYAALLVWNGMGIFMFYTTVRDDIRNELVRKEKKK